jgi:hypothetical protein
LVDHEFYVFVAESNAGLGELIVHPELAAPNATAAERDAGLGEFVW